MVTSRFLALVPTIALAGLTGCGPDKLDAKYSLDLLGESKRYELEPQSKPQKITVDFTASTGEAAVGLFKRSDAPQTDPLDPSKKPEKALGWASGKSGEFSVDVPANTATTVFVMSTKGKASIELKFTNQK